MFRQAIRNYVAIPGYKTRIIDNFEEHYAWMNLHKPQLAVLYFRNDWNPECSRQFAKEYLNLFLHEDAFKTFIIDTWTGQGERTKKYYSVRYEPSFMFLSDGFELKVTIGGDIQKLKADFERVKEFRKKLSWSCGMTGGPDQWENHHDEHMKRWKNHNEQESYRGMGTIMLDRN